MLMQDMTKEELKEFRVRICMEWLKAQQESKVRPTKHKWNYPKGHVMRWSGTYIGASHFVEAMRRLNFKHSGDCDVYPTPWLNKNLVYPSYDRIRGLGVQLWEGGNSWTRMVHPHFVTGPRYVPYRLVEGHEEVRGYKEVDLLIGEAIFNWEKELAQLPILPLDWEKR